MSTAMTQLRERLAELTDLRHAGQLLGWDQQTMMPAGGAASRAEVQATIERISHRLFVEAETGRLLEAAAAELNGAEPDSDDARLVAVVRRRWEKARRVPTELAAEIARAASLGHEAWVGARANSDFSAFAPHLARNVELAHRYTECLPEFERPYDALLDDYEPGVTSEEVTRIFAELRDELVPLIARVSAAEPVDDSYLHESFPVARQRELVDRVLRRMGFARDHWRLDEAAHPFATSFGCDDVRLTTRWDEHYFPGALYGAMHECGHGLYEAGIARSLQRTPLGHAESLGLHESQSRMWENLVGRGRAFARVLAPLVAELTGRPIEPDALFRAVNRVQPSFIRVEADEATYGLHIVLRFELEQELVEGRLRVEELPEAWNARFAEYLGLEVTDDALGVLQDVHWAAGLIGYFPTYALGNLIAGQLWRRVHADVPDLDEQIAAGELSGLREWLREHVHRHGAKFRMPELVQRVTGGPVQVEPFVSYLKDKLGAVYGLDLHDLRGDTQTRNPQGAESD
ncbi:MAG TPA: carboxypeptidase M32 [Solirubrobacteraceae bacterium]|nr:carboxypeptidase M32 [Solirubrobacteraceae bacterium]